MRTKGVGHEETKQKLLKTARALVLKHGHEKLSLREIARRAGFGPASLYEYFDGKPAIVEALARDAGASLKLALDASARSAATATHERSEQGPGPDAAGDASPLRAARALDVLVELGMAYVAWAKQHPQDFLLLFGRLPSTRKALTERSASDSPYRVVLDAVRRVGAGGAIPIRDLADAERLAYGLWVTAHGMAMLQLTHLATFKTDFAAADRAVLAALVRGWKA